jgi:hypothetical protein
MRRNEIPAPLADPAVWPGVDTSALDPKRRAIYQRREAAVCAWLAGSPLASIERRFGINRGTLQRLVERCLLPHSDGRIQGMRALIPHARAKAYRRTAPALRRQDRAGLTGAMGQLFERLPQLTRIVEREIAGGDLYMTASNRLKAGFTLKDYPFNQQEKGYRSLSAWVRRRLQERIPLLPLSRADAWAATTRPFSVVELDGHKLDLRVRVRFVDASGVAVDLESERLFVVALIDVCTRVVLGWQLVPAPEYDHHDVLGAIQDALRPRRRRDAFLSPGLAYRPGAGFVADVLPQLGYACWDVLKVDNAASHLTEDTFEPICRFVGCRMEAGPIGEPTARPFIERFFGTLQKRMSSKVEGTTRQQSAGSSRQARPQGARRAPRDTAGTRRTPRRPHRQLPRHAPRRAQRPHAVGGAADGRRASPGARAHPAPAPAQPTAPAPARASVYRAR